MALPLERLEGKYEIVAKMQEGGMGAIYKVRHRLLDELRVIKMLRARFQADSEVNERFAREARAAIRLRHPNVVQIFDYLIEGGTGYIVMEYIRGIDLEQLIARHPLPSLPLALEIGRQSLRALGYLHHNGFVHRDVSPDNLMLSRAFDDKPLVKMIDLGIAKNLESSRELTASGMFMGKFRYSSPEHFSSAGTGGVEVRSDVYSFAVVFYELLTGRYPIRGEGQSQLIAGHLFHPPLDFATTDPQGRIPTQLRQAVLKALDKDLDNRFASAAELSAVIESLQDRFPVTAETIAEAQRLSQAEDRDHQPVHAAGSTQSRLDRSFGFEPTPRPESHPAVALTVVPGEGSTATAEMPATAERPAGRREEQIKALLAGAETLHRFGQTEQAKDQLTAILRLSPDHPEALRLLAALEEEGKGDLKAADETFDRCVETACRLADEENFAAAIDHLQAALEVRPDNQTVQVMLAEARENLDRQREESLRQLESEVLQLRQQVAAGELRQARERLVSARRAYGDVEALKTVSAEIRQAAEADLEAAVDRVERLISEGQLMEADRVLFQTREDHGPNPRLRALRTRLDELHHREHESQVRALVEQAESQAAAGELAGALELLQKAYAVAPERSQVRAQLQDREKRWRREAAARRTERAKTELEARIRERIEEHLLDEAEAELNAAEARYGRCTAFRSLRQLVAQGYRAELEALVREAGIALEAGRWEVAVRFLRQALELAPEDRWLRARLRQAEDELGHEKERQRQEAEREEQLRALVREARQAQAAGDDLKARLLVAKALEQAPDDPEARTVIETLHARDK